MKMKIIARIFIALLLTALAAAGSAEQQTSAQAGIIHRIENGPARMALEITNGSLGRESFLDGLAAGRAMQTPEGRNFVIRLQDRELGPSDFAVRTSAKTSAGLELVLRANDLPLTVKLNYRQNPGDFFIRKWLELEPDPGAQIFVDEIVLWDFIPWTPAKSFMGPGQPVYVGDAFFGLEYPSSRNDVENGQARCGCLVGLAIDESGYVSPKAVYGSAAPGRTREAFLAYIDQVRARPVKQFTLYNTWYDLYNFSADEVIHGIEGLKKHLYQDRGVNLDSIVLDDGYDDFNDLWRPDPRRFPDGFEPLVKAAAGMDSHLGLWMSPVGGYGTNHTRRILGSLGRGFEKSGQGFCVAGETHKKYFADTMVMYAREYGVNYFKLDNLTRACNNPLHGHRVGRYEQVGLTDAFIEVMTIARRAKPDLMINITVGSWLSPWWLLHCDVVWRSGMDFGFWGEGNNRQQSITYVDKILYQKLRVEEAQFPVNSLMTHGVIKGRRLPRLGGAGEDLRDFSDHVWMYFCRGVQMQELYVTPDLLNQDEWDLLARVIQFSRGHAVVLAKMEMMGGDPERGQVYGFLGADAHSRLAVIRNPQNQARTIPAQIAKSIYQDKDSSCRLHYSSVSCADFLSPLQPLEVRVIECMD